MFVSFGSATPVGLRSGDPLQMAPGALRPGTREAIVDAATALFAENAGATLAEVALRAGVGRATLHRHFAGREQLVEAITFRSLEDTNAAVAAALRPGMAAREELAALFEAMVPLGDRYRFLAKEEHWSEEVRAAYGEQLAWLAGLVERLKAEGEIDPAIPDRWVVAQVDQLLWSAWSAVGRGEIAALEAPALAVRSLLSGLAP